MLCAFIFIHEWQDLQFKVSEIFEKLLLATFYFLSEFLSEICSEVVTEEIFSSYFTSMTSWQVMIRGFTRMSPKVNSRRLYGCFKMNQIQQKLLAHEALPSK